MSALAVEVGGLRKTFRRPRDWRLWKPQVKVALSGVDLNVREGEIFGLLGPNGAGKTTLIKILCGLVLPDAGRALVKGRDVVSASRAVRAMVGVVYGDERSFMMRLSIRENLRFYASLYGLYGKAAERRIDELIELVDLQGYADVRMHHLSSGYKQRGAIARGLVHDPEILFMDEPTRSLDPLATEELHNLIRDRILARRRTVLLATHLMSEVEVLCSRLALLDGGQAIHVGTVDELRATVREEALFRLVFSGGRPGWERGLAVLPGVLKADVNDRDGRHQIELAIDRHSGALAHAIRYLVEQGGDIQSCTQLELSLDDVFRAVVRSRRARREEVRV